MAGYFAGREWWRYGESMAGVSQADREEGYILIAWMTRRMLVYLLASHSIPACLQKKRTPSLSEGFVCSLDLLSDRRS